MRVELSVQVWLFSVLQCFLFSQRTVDFETWALRENCWLRVRHLMLLYYPGKAEKDKSSLKLTEETNGYQVLARRFCSVSVKNSFLRP